MKFLLNQMCTHFKLICIPISVDPRCVYVGTSLSIDKHSIRVKANGMLITILFIVLRETRVTSVCRVHWEKESTLNVQICCTRLRVVIWMAKQRLFNMFGQPVAGHISGTRLCYKSDRINLLLSKVYFAEITQFWGCKNMTLSIARTF